MAMVDLAVNAIRNKGWLSLATLFFDNGCTISVFNTGGDVAYSPSEDVFFSMNALDSTNTIQIQSQYAVTGDRHYVGQQQILTTIGSEHLQHFSYATYAHANFFSDRTDGMKGPKIPTMGEITAMTADPNTHLYAGTDTVERMVGDTISTLAIYPHLKHRYSGVIIDGWKAFYENHRKFISFVRDITGCSDAI